MSVDVAGGSDAAGSADAAGSGRVLALIDGNSFYCSCERLFDGRLSHRPVIVLSNNDGCAIARTAEAKALGIRMGHPYFQIRELCRQERVAVFSSNYTLYGDMSRRMNEVYRSVSPDVEVYSIDESFLDLTAFGSRDRVAMARDLRATVRRWLGLPTCVGLGPTKVLAKLANHIAKCTPELDGVCDLTTEAARARWMPRIAVGETWGVGRASAEKLRRLGVMTVADLARLEPRVARAAMTVVGERIVHELQGTPCLALELVPATRKGCAVTRCFSGRVEALDEVLEAVAAHATRLAEKLRREGLGTDHVSVFYHTSEHDRGAAQRSASLTVRLPEATSCTLTLVAAAKDGARRIWAEGYRYSKAGVVTVDLARLEESPRALIGALDRERSGRLMAALDACNARFGRGAVVPAAAGWPTKRTWSTKFEMKSPRYTTRVDELPIAKAGAAYAAPARSG